MNTASAGKPSLPIVPIPDPTAIPPEIRSAKSWIVWRAEWKNQKGKWKLNKVPCDPVTGHNLSMADRASWSNLEAAIEAVQNLRSRLGNHYGIGIAFHDGIGVICADLDGDLIDGISERLQWILDNHPTWMEVSVSGNGVHAFYFGRFDRKRKVPWRGSAVEIFGTVGFIAITGNVLDGASTNIGDGTALVAEILTGNRNKTSTRNKAGESQRSTESIFTDSQLIEKAKHARNGALFGRLWAGDTSDYNGDDSLADLALCSHLSFWCAGDQERIDRLFRQSGLYREKWEREDYREATIEKATEGKTEFFCPKPRANGKRQGKQPASEIDDEDQSKTGASIILNYFRERYRPVFKRGNSIFCEDGEEIPMNVATAVPDSNLIEELAYAEDAPKYQGGGIRRNSLSRIFQNLVESRLGRFAQVFAR